MSDYDNLCPCCGEIECAKDTDNVGGLRRERMFHDVMRDLKRQFPADWAIADSYVRSLEEKVIELCRAAPAGSGEVEPPKWYTREEIVSTLRLMNYSDLIAQELADWFVRHLQHAFNKGHRIGQRDAALLRKLQQGDSNAT